MLAEVRTAQDAMDIASLAEAARVWARQAKLGAQAENHATGIKLKAEIRLAQVVKEGQERGEIAGHGGNRKVRNADVETLSDLGVDKQRLAEARTLAATFTPSDVDEVVDEANAEGRSVSRRAVLKAAAVGEAKRASTPPRDLETDRLKHTAAHIRAVALAPHRPLEYRRWARNGGAGLEDAERAATWLADVLGRRSR
jgi:hypothetical protein